MEYTAKGFENALRMFKDVSERGEELLPNTARVRGSLFSFATNAPSVTPSDTTEEHSSSVVEEEPPQENEDANTFDHMEALKGMTKKGIGLYMEKHFDVVLDTSQNKKDLLAEAEQYIV